MKTLREVYQQFSDISNSVRFQELARKQLDEFRETNGEIPEMVELDSMLSIYDVMQSAIELIRERLLVRGSKYTTSNGETIKITRVWDRDGKVCYKKGTDSFKEYYSYVIKELYGENMCIGHIDGRLPKDCFCPDFKDKCDEIVSSLS